MTISAPTLETLQTQIKRDKDQPLSQSELKAFAEELDQLKKDISAKVGAEDIVYIEMVRDVCRACEIAGRLLLHFSLEPVSWALGVLCLYVHLQLDNLELNHHIQHGAYDRLPEARPFHSDVYYHNSPVDEEAWRYRHNILHHSYTGQVDRDPDVTYGFYRLGEMIDKQPFHSVQPLVLILNTINSSENVGLLSSGLMEFIQMMGIPGYSDLGYPSVNKSTDFEGFLKSFHKSFRKVIPNAAYNYGLYGLLAGPLMWPKVTLGTLSAVVLRNIFTGLAFYTGHMVEGVKHYDAPPKNKAEWYWQQVEGSANVEAGGVFSVLAGHLNYQIEHHLFPKLPPNRLVEISPQVREICERYGVTYRTGSFAEQVGSLFNRLIKYSK